MGSHWRFARGLGPKSHMAARWHNLDQVRGRPRRRLIRDAAVRDARYARTYLRIHVAPLVFRDSEKWRTPSAVLYAWACLCLMQAGSFAISTCTPPSRRTDARVVSSTSTVVLDGPFFRPPFPRSGKRKGETWHQIFSQEASDSTSASGSWISATGMTGDTISGVIAMA